jgi:hypothetical protein
MTATCLFRLFINNFKIIIYFIIGDLGDLGGLGHIFGYYNQCQNKRPKTQGIFPVLQDTSLEPCF